jgi:hypothetical protein
VVLHSVSCGLGIYDCVTVGEAYGGEVPSNPFGEVETNGVWEVSSLPTPPQATGAELASVSCAGGVCEAVGNYSVPVGRYAPLFTQHLLANRFSGGKWTIQAQPADPFNLSQQLSGVSCVSATYCVAGGWAIVKGVDVAMSEIWDGRSWADRATVSMSPGTKHLLAAVACVSTVDCEAVGERGGNPLAELWNGRQWSIQNLSTGAAELESVSCAGTFCMAVGRTLAEIAQAGVWSPLRVHALKPATPDAVACTSPTICVVSGTSGKHYWAGSWNGTSWVEGEIQPAFSVIGWPQGVSCVARHCTAVTTASGWKPGSGANTVIERTTSA